RCRWRGLDRLVGLGLGFRSGPAVAGGDDSPALGARVALKFVQQITAGAARLFDADLDAQLAFSTFADPGFEGLRALAARAGNLDAHLRRDGLVAVAGLVRIDHGEDRADERAAC